MTKKQKEEKAAAELRKQALLASGVQIEALQQPSGSGAGGVKKVVYGNRKRPNKKDKDNASATDSRPQTPDQPEPEPTLVVIAKEEKPASTGDVVSDWDASSGDEKKAADVKDDWDASSDEEGKAPKGVNFGSL